ncbi:hypothetical protein D3C84_620400 [compost metagenome]
MLLEQLQGVLDLRRDVLGRGQRFLRRGDVRFEVRVGARCRQHLMHFPQSLTEHAGEVFELAEGVVMLLLLGHGICQLVAQGPFEVVLRPFPGVALIAQVALGDHQQVVFACGVAAHHCTQ